MCIRDRPKQRDKARLLGLSLALIMRLGLLSLISWMVTLTKPLFTVMDFSFSGRDLIMLFGGIFLLFKATTEPVSYTHLLCEANEPEKADKKTVESQKSVEDE